MAEQKFDIEVEYHLFVRTGDPADRAEPAPPKGQRPAARDREPHFSHTQPQRFTPRVDGPDVRTDGGPPAPGRPGHPAGGVPEGDYRLAITITDVVAGNSSLRDTGFSVVH